MIVCHERSDHEQLLLAIYIRHNVMQFLPISRFPSQHATLAVSLTILLMLQLDCSKPEHVLLLTILTILIVMLVVIRERVLLIPWLRMFTKVPPMVCLVY